MRQSLLIAAAAALGALVGVGGAMVGGYYYAKSKGWTAKAAAGAEGLAKLGETAGTLKKFGF